MDEAADADDRTTRPLTRRRLIVGGAITGAAALAASSTAQALADEISGGARATASPRRVRAPDRLPPGSYEPGTLYVALYGSPGSTQLGALGEQSVEATVARARAVAAGYNDLGRPVVPTFEIIGSVASAFPGADGDYSNEFPASKFLPLIEAASDNAFHVVVDLQSGRSPFFEQILEYEEVLSFPHVSVALDPEWRFDAPGIPGGGRVGTVDAVEVNRTIAWLDDLVTRKRLPTKLVVLHQFTPSMVTNKAQIRSTLNCQVMMHMDGFGSLPLKRGSWGRMVDDLPPGALTGWKNFYDEDNPTPTPEETLDNEPRPMFVSYQ
ncbi:MAG: hypothetical protein AB8G26_10015 [Ilumatobacter sp.]